MIAGRYTLLREIGRGGSGVVWLAQDDALGREVAMKRLLRTGDERAEGRAWREARVAASLHHPHLVAIYDVVEDLDDLWLVMEYVAGGTLAAAVAASGPHDPSTAARIGLQIADGLAYAHHAGVVHRDVKPSNILLSSDRQAKLADFGIARSNGLDATVTQTGAVHGSPAYLAPEVAAGGSATALSDVWSLGATLFHVVTGAPPYGSTDGNLVGVLYRIVHDPVPRTDRAGWLEPVLSGAMTREPGQRWSLGQIQEFLLAGPPDHGTVERLPPVYAPAPATYVGLETALLPSVGTTDTRADASPTRVRPPSRSRPLWFAAVVLLIAAAVALGVPGIRRELLGQHSTSTPPTGEAAITSFVQTYVTTAPVDQTRAFAMLTPRYQQASGGLAGYESFWTQVSSIDAMGAIRVVNGQSPTATYTYTYTRRGKGVVTETVTLRLVQTQGGYLIDDATSRQP